MKRTSGEKHDEANGKRKPRRSKEGKSEPFNIEKAKKEWTSDELDLTKEFRPLTDYLDNKEKLIDEIFNAIRSRELRERIPKILKSYSVEQVKKMCLEELQNLSDNEILHLMGKMSDSGVHISNVSIPMKPTSSFNSQYEKKELHIETNKSCNSSTLVTGEVAETLYLHADQDEINSLIRGAASRKHQMQSSTGETMTGDESQSSELIKEIGVSSSTNTLKQSSGENRLSDICSESLSSDEGKKSDWLSVFTKTQMEILELELRAKAIRSLMQAQGAVLSDDDSSQNELPAEES